MPSGGAPHNTGTPARTESQARQDPRLSQAKISKEDAENQKLLAQKLAGAKQQLSKPSRKLFDAWIAKPSPDVLGTLDSLMASGLMQVAAIMNCVAQSSAPERKKAEALGFLSAVLQEAYDKGLGAEWTASAVLGAISAYGKTAQLPVSQQGILLMVRVLLDVASADGSQAGTPGRLGIRFKPSELALLVNRLSKFALCLDGAQEHYAELLLAVEIAASEIEARLAEGKSAAEFNFKNLAQIANGLARFRSSNACFGAITQSARCAQTLLAKSQAKAFVLDPGSVDISPVNLCAFVNGIAAFGGKAANFYDADHGLEPKTADALESAIVAAASFCAARLASLGGAHLGVLAQLVSGFAHFARLPACRSIVVQLTRTVDKELGSRVGMALGPLHLKCMSMIAGGFGDVAPWVTPAAHADIDRAIGTLCKCLDSVVEALASQKLEHLCFLLHGLSKFEVVPASVVDAALRTLANALAAIVADWNKGHRLSLNRVDLRSLVVLANALGRLQIERRSMHLVQSVAAIVAEKLKLSDSRQGNVSTLERFSRARLAILLRSLAALDDRVPDAARPVVGSTLDQLAGAIGAAGALDSLDPYELAEALRGLGRQAARKPCLDALHKLLNLVPGVVLGASATPGGSPMLSALGALAKGIGACRLDGADERKLLRTAIAPLAGALMKRATELDAQALSDCIRGCGAFADLPACQSALGAFIEATPGALDPKRPDAAASASGRVELGINLCKLDRQFVALHQASIDKALESVMKSIKADVASRQIEVRHIQRLLEAAADMGSGEAASRFKAQATTASLMHLEQARADQLTVRYLACALTSLCVILTGELSDPKLVDSARASWRSFVERLGARLGDALSSDDFSALAALMAALALPACEEGDFADECACAMKYGIDAMMADSAAWLAQCTPEDLAQVLSALMQARMIDDAKYLLSRGCLQLFNVREGRMALLHMKAPTLGRLCSALHDVVVLRGMRRHRPQALRVLLDSVLPPAWALIESHRELGAQLQKAAARTSDMPNPTLFYYLVAKAGAAAARCWDARYLPDEKADQLALNRKRLNAQTLQVCDWLREMEGPDRLDKQSWNRVAQMEAAEPSGPFSAFATTAYDFKQALAPPAKFDWMDVFAGLAKQGHIVSPTGGVGVMAVPHGSVSGAVESGVARGPRYAVMNRLSGGALKLALVALPQGVTADLLRRTFIFDGQPYRIDVAGGSGMKPTRDTVEDIFSKADARRAPGGRQVDEGEPGKVYAVPLQDTHPGTSFAGFMEKLFPNVEAFYYFQRALMNGGPSSLDAEGPSSHALEGLFTLGVLPDVEDGEAHPFQLASKDPICLRPHDGLGFMKETVAQKWPWYAKLHRSPPTGPSTAPQGVLLRPFGGTEANANLVPDALQHYPYDEKAAKEIAGDIVNFKAEKAALYRGITQGRRGKGHIAKAVPSSDGCVHLPVTKKVGKSLLLGRSPYEAPKLQPVADGDVKREGATSALLDTSAWIQYSFVGSALGDPSLQLSFFKGAVLVVPDKLWPEAFKACDMVVSASDEKTRTSWTGTQKNRHTEFAMVQFGGIFVATEVFPGGSCVAIPSATQSLMGGDFDGDDLLMVSDLPELYRVVASHRGMVVPSVLKLRPSHTPAFVEGQYFLDRAPQMACITNNVLGLFTSLQRQLKMASREQVHALAPFVMEALCGGLTVAMAEHLRVLASGPMSDGHAGQELQDLLVQALKTRSPSSGARLQQLHDEVASDKANFVASAAQDQLALLMKPALPPADRVSRLELWLHYMPVCAASVPAGVAQLCAGERYDEALDILILHGIKCGEDAFKSEVNIADLHVAALRLRDLLASLALPPYTRSTARLMADGKFGLDAAIRMRNALQGRTNLAAGVMLETIGALMDRDFFGKLAHKYVPPALPAPPHDTGARSIEAPDSDLELPDAPPQQLAGLCEHIVQGHAAKLDDLVRSLRSGVWLADKLPMGLLVGVAECLQKNPGRTADRLAAALADRLKGLFQSGQWQVESVPQCALALAKILHLAWDSLDDAARRPCKASEGIPYMLEQLCTSVCRDLFKDEVDVWGLLLSPSSRCVVLYRLLAPSCVLRTEGRLTAQQFIAALAGHAPSHPFNLAVRSDVLVRENLEPSCITRMLNGMQESEAWFSYCALSFDGSRQAVSGHEALYKQAKYSLSTVCSMVADLYGAPQKLESVNAMLGQATSIARGATPGKFMLESLVTLIEKVSFQHFGHPGFGEFLRTFGDRMAELAGDSDHPLQLGDAGTVRACVSRILWRFGTLPSELYKAIWAKDSRTTVAVFVTEMLKLIDYQFYRFPPSAFPPLLMAWHSIEDLRRCRRRRRDSLQFDLVGLSIEQVNSYAGITWVYLHATSLKISLLGSSELVNAWKDAYKERK